MRLPLPSILESDDSGEDGAAPWRNKGPMGKAQRSKSDSFCQEPIGNRSPPRSPRRKPRAKSSEHAPSSQSMSDVIVDPFRSPSSPTNSPRSRGPQRAKSHESLPPQLLEHGVVASSSSPRRKTRPNRNQFEQTSLSCIPAPSSTTSICTTSNCHSTTTSSNSPRTPTSSRKLTVKSDWRYKSSFTSFASLDQALESALVDPFARPPPGAASSTTPSCCNNNNNSNNKNNNEEYGLSNSTSTFLTSSTMTATDNDDSSLEEEDVHSCVSLSSDDNDDDSSCASSGSSSSLDALDDLLVPLASPVSPSSRWESSDSAISYHHAPPILRRFKSIPNLDANNKDDGDEQEEEEEEEEALFGPSEEDDTNEVGIATQ